MPIIIDDPCFARLEGYAGKEDAVEKHLVYRDLRAAYELRRFQTNQWNRSKYTDEEYEAKVEELKVKVKNTLLRRTDDGRLWIPAGLAEDIAMRMNDTVEDQLPPPRVKPYAWAKVPEKIPRPYQQDAYEALLAARHGCVELAPGTGKTLLALMLVRNIGLPAVVVSPFGAILRQTYREFVEALGAKRVGIYGDGKHDIKKDVTIATAQSLKNIEPGSDRWNFFAKKAVFIFDESHMAPADTLASVCFGLMGKAPFRFFLSGTQLRTDGLQLLLQGIVGPIKLSMNVREAVDQGWLARPAFRMIEVRNGKLPKSTDPGIATREALYQSPAVAGMVTSLANRMVKQGRPVLIMVDELEQFSRLFPGFAYEAKFAHGCTDKKVLQKKVPAPFHEVDTLELVDDFNAGRYPILVGTSCVGTGVDVRATGAGFYLRGGKSETDIRQTCGRFMRLFPGKSDVIVFDIDIMDGVYDSSTDFPIVHRHALERWRVYEKLYPDVQRVSFGGPK